LLSSVLHVVLQFPFCCVCARCAAKGTIQSTNLAASFVAALWKNPAENAHDALARLNGDGLAQVLTYIPFLRKLRSLCAVGPLTRVYAEVLTTHNDYIINMCSVQVYRGELMYLI
jgi:hypothetical protein